MRSRKIIEGASLEEMISELRWRERRAGEGKRTAAARGRSGLARHLEAVPTATLIRAARERQLVVYGTDDRRDLYEVRTRRIGIVAESVAALVRSSRLRRNADGSFALKTNSYRDDYDLCRSEPFASQPLGCFCSAFLVRRDVIATAGHCVTRRSDLAHMRFVFGFRMLNKDRARTIFDPEDVYAGRELIGRQQVEKGPDWALVRLDRPVKGRRPLSIRTLGRIADHQSVFVIGHPNGLPTKFADGARVRDNTPSTYFVANLDTYGGNSGSPVFNAATYKVEGILVRGENDFVKRGACNVSLVCPTTGCRGEDVTRSTVWAGRIPRRGA